MITISVENLSKTYRLGQIGTGRFADDLNVWWAKTRGKSNPLLKIGEKDHGNRAGEELWALRDINFTVEQGDVLGIIGRNGAGKSTLLKILSRVTAPTFGKIKVKGRIASLLEVGTGFHPELTGRENVYLNGAIFGMSRKEIGRKFEEIVDFSEIEKFIDTPVKRYSSGMYVRLAFAVAAHLEPEILIVDEVLAVGDAEFQKKCLGKMGDVAGEGRTVLFVSHNIGSLRKLCLKGLCLDQGLQKKEGTIEDCVEYYLDSVLHHDADGNGKSEVSFLQVTDIYINGSEKREVFLNSGIRKISIKIVGKCDQSTRMAFEAKLCDHYGNALGYFGPAHFYEDGIDRLTVHRGEFVIDAEIVLPHMTKGDFMLDLFIAEPAVKILWELRRSVYTQPGNTP